MRVVELAGETPLARWILRVLRDPATGPEEFRSWTARAGKLLAAFIARELEWREARVETPLGAQATELEPAKPPLLVAVLGAGLPLLQGLADMLPGSSQGFIAAKRIEEGDRIEIRIYYERLPARIDQPAVIADPMLATGKTIAAAAEILRKRGAKKIITASIIASKPGITYLQAAGTVDAVYTLTIDPHLDHRYFIVPGLGDAGDRALAVKDLSIAEA